MSDNYYDVIIIGGGPAGLTAGIYASREMLNTLLLEKQVCGGLPATTELIENYPGFPEGIHGMEMMARFKKQAERFGLKIEEIKEVKNVTPAGKDKRMRVKVDEKEYSAYAVIVASGSVPKILNIPGEKEYRAKGVSYCATCDGPLYKGRDVAVIGCGNSGLQEGEALLKYVKSVTFIEFLPYMTAAKILQDRLQKHKNAKFYLNHALTSIKGGKQVDSVTVKDRETGKEKELTVSGVFIYAGFLPNSGFLKGITKLDKEGYIATNGKMETSEAGIYAAGDVCSKDVRKVTTACADGTIAAISALRHIRESAG